MHTFISIGVVLLVTYYTPANGQFFGGHQTLPGGGSFDKIGYQAGPAWGSLSQSHDSRGFGSPISVGAGANFQSKQGHGIGGQVDVIPGLGGQGNLRGQLGVLNTPNHHVDVWAQHNRILDGNLRPIGPETNSAGVNYLNKNNGAGAFLSGSQTNGFPATGTVGGSIPIIHKPNTDLSLSGQTQFGHGMKPNHQVGLQFNHRF